MKSKEFIQQNQANQRDLGQRIIGLRNDANKMSRETLSEKAKIPLDTLIKIERGTQMTAVDKLKRIANVFNVTVDSLLIGMTFKFAA